MEEERTREEIKREKTDGGGEGKREGKRRVR